MLKLGTGFGDRFDLVRCPFRQPRTSSGPRTVVSGTDGQQRFVRLDPSKPGHGLGLAIARCIAQHHEGDLTCDPTSSGASFTLLIPSQL
jgi:hypothetical protein